MSRTVEDRPLGGSDAENAAAEAAAAESSAEDDARPSVEVHLRAGLVTDDPVPTCLPVTLRHDPARDPRAVSFVLPAAGPSPDRPVWTVPRALLEAGLRSPAEQDGVRIWPCGRVQAVLELHTARGTVLLQFDCAPLVRFLRQTYAA